MTRRAAAEGDDRDAVLGGPGEHCRHVVVTTGPHHRVGGVGEVTGAGPEQVEGGLAARAQPPGRVVGEDVLGAESRPQVVEERGLDLRGRDGDRLVGGGAGELAEGQLDQPARGVGQRGRGSRVAPAGGVHLPDLGDG